MIPNHKSPEYYQNYPCFEPVSHHALKTNRNAWDYPQMNA